ncbi:uncharacterized protein ARMOST_17728 [Armillaria ostoyae]|uniref:Uncharacterized protein n=1 Tax=Armillaria ostoyae TaxID=47428 RepID=A0A284RZT1_ARMOS|nr:uncharacterized protein ARMOST_17728 [Armillaria ostoyae]
MYDDSQGAILGDRTNVYDDNNVNTGNDNDLAKKALAVQEYEARVARILRVRAHAAARLVEAARETEKYRHCKLFDWVSTVQWKPQVNTDDGSTLPLSATEGNGKKYRLHGWTSSTTSESRSEPPVCALPPPLPIDSDTEERTAPIQDPQHDAQSTPLDISAAASQPLSPEVISLLEMLAPTLSRLQSSPQIAPVEMQ